MKSRILISLGFLGLLAAGLSIFGSTPKDKSTAKMVIFENPEVPSVKSLCQAKEQVIWTCSTTNNKIASVCASKNLDADQGYVQYRFGKMGKIELVLPREKVNSQNFFTYSRYTRPLVTMLTLSFENNGFKYEIHVDDNSEEKPPVRMASIDISNGDRLSSISCKQPTYGSLMKLEDIVPRDEK